MWIIIEGPDGAGKSTLAENLREHLGNDCRVTHGMPPRSPETAIAEVMEVRNSYVPHGPSLISDRLHWSCPVYGPLFRPAFDDQGYGEMGPDGWRYCELAIAAKGGITVAVTGRADVLLVRAKSRPEGDQYMADKWDRFPDIVSRYDSLSPQSITCAARTSLIGLSGEETSMLVHTILDMGERAEEIGRVLGDLGSDYVGTNYPEVLVVHDNTIRSQRIDLVGRMGPFWHVLGMVDAGHYEVAKEALDPALIYSFNCDIPSVTRLDQPNDLPLRIREDIASGKGD